MSTVITLRDTLRQMVAVLQTERQALAGLDIDEIMGCANDKRDLCDRLGAGDAGLAGADAALADAECRGLLDAARRLNEVNRQIRNLIAANVTARLDVLTGSPALYHARPANGPARLRLAARN